MCALVISTRVFFLLQLAIIVVMSQSRCFVQLLWMCFFCRRAFDHHLLVAVCILCLLLCQKPKTSDILKVSREYILETATFCDVCMAVSQKVEFSTKMAADVAAKVTEFCK